MSWDSQYETYNKEATAESRVEWLAAKLNSSPQELRSGIPNVYHSFLVTVLSLAEDDTPNYEEYIHSFRKAV